MQHSFSFIFLLIKPLHFQFGHLYLYPVKTGIFSLYISPRKSSHSPWWFSCLLPHSCCWLCPCRPPMGSSPISKNRMKTWIFLYGHSFFLLFQLCSSQIQTTDASNNSTLKLNYRSNFFIIFFDSLWDLNFKCTTAESSTEM